VSTPDGEFLPPVIFDKFAALAKAHDKKLIIVFHPARSHLVPGQTGAGHISVQAEAEMFKSVCLSRRAVRALAARGLTQAEHLYVGYERFSSHRLAFYFQRWACRPGRWRICIVAGIIAGGEGQSGRWKLRRQVVLRGPCRFAAIEPGWRIVETEKNERHYFQTRISGLEADRYCQVAVSYKPIGISVSLRDGRQEGSAWCDPRPTPEGAQFL
jgi:hypothetical protein